MPTTCGTVSLGSWPGNGICEDSAVEVRFGFSFDTVPRVVVQLAGFDAASPDTKRIEAWASDATCEGFRVHARTWSNSITYSAKVSWIASSEPAVVQLGTLSLGNSCSWGSDPVPVEFDEPFACSPDVTVALATVDAKGDEHLRIWSESCATGSRGFQLSRRSWESSVVWGAKVSFVASTSPAVLQCGSVKLGSWPDDAIKADAERHVDVSFPRAFDSSPSVALALAGIDADWQHPTRIDTRVDEVTREGFRLYVKSWEDSVTWAVKVSWVATPVLPNATESRVPPHQPPMTYVVDGPPLGQGWWGVTHRARHAVNGHLYAVKTCRHPFLQHEQELRQELRNLAQLPVHFNLLRYHECILHADRLHIVTEYLDAFKLTDLVPGPEGLCPCRHTTATLLRWICQLCDGLAHLHAAGIVHRDLHGDNILVERDLDGQPSQSHRAIRIIDFGAAGFYGDQTRPRLMSREAGCWQYFSPERRRGLPFDDRDDVWAAGCHLVELASGRLIRKREGCGHEGIDFAITPTQIARAIIDCDCSSGRCGSGRCCQLAQALLDQSCETRPRAGAVRDTIRGLLTFSPGKRAGPSGAGRGIRPLPGGLKAIPTTPVPSESTDGECQALSQ